MQACKPGSVSFTTADESARAQALIICLAPALQPGSISLPAPIIPPPTESESGR